MRHLNEFPLSLEELARCCGSYAREFEKEGSAGDERPELLRAAARLISLSDKITSPEKVVSPANESCGE